MQRGLELAGWGTLTRDMTLRLDRTGCPFTTAVIAVTTGPDETTWVRAHVFGDAAEAAVKSLRKGARLYFEGTGRLRSWKTADGEQRVDLEARCWKLERSPSIGQHRRQEAGKPLGAPLGKPGPKDWQAPLFDDGLPF
jgi:single-stranded DNA-binding protein